MKRERVENHK